MQLDGTTGLAFRLGKLEGRVEAIERTMATVRQWGWKVFALVALFVYASATNLKTAELGELLAGLAKGLR